MNYFICKLIIISHESIFYIKRSQINYKITSSYFMVLSYHSDSLAIVIFLSKLNNSVSFCYLISWTPQKNYFKT